MFERFGEMNSFQEINELAENLFNEGDLKSLKAMATRYMTLQKLLNRIEKYAGCEYGTGCYSASERIRHTAITYADYLSM